MSSNLFVSCRSLEKSNSGAEESKEMLEEDEEEEEEEFDEEDALIRESGGEGEKASNGERPSAAEMMQRTGRDLLFFKKGHLFHNIKKAQNILFTGKKETLS